MQNDVRIRMLTPLGSRLDRQRREALPRLLAANAIDVSRAASLAPNPVDDELATITHHLLGRLRDSGGRGKYLDALVRSDREEFLDLNWVPGIIKRVGMRRLHQYNRLSGGYPLFRKAIVEALRGQRDAHVYDLAAGTGGLARWLAAHPPRGHQLRITSSDLEPSYLEIGRRTARRRGLELTFEARNACDLHEVKDVDLFVCTQATHHLGPVLLVQVIAQAIRASPGGLLVIDALRAANITLAVALSSAAFAPWLPHFAHDAALSVRRSWTPTELALLATLAGASRVEVAMRDPGYCVLHARR